MRCNPTSQTILFEHLFWLQVLGDHGRFIFSNLSPKEENEFNKAYNFITMFDQLYEQACNTKSPQQVMEVTNTALVCAKNLREFKLHLLSRQVMDKIDLHLPPSLLNHMVNELEEYLGILDFFYCENSLPDMHPLHHELLWVKDAQVHASILSTGLNDTEIDLKKKSDEFMKLFNKLHDKAVEFNGYLRIGIKNFPALCRYNSEVELKINIFREFLYDLRQLLVAKETLGIIVPLIPDHMLREECYFLIKLSEVSAVQMPDCTPTKPRFEG